MSEHDDQCEKEPSPFQAAFCYCYERSLEREVANLEAFRDEVMDCIRWAGSLKVSDIEEIHDKHFPTKEQ